MINKLPMEHLTKEEIINKHWDDPTNLLDAVPKIMDEFANQEKEKALNDLWEWLNDEGFLTDDMGEISDRYDTHLQSIK